jgi:hypothetical protein
LENVSVWAVLRGYPIQDWQSIRREHQNVKLKGRFDEFIARKSVKKSPFQDWMDEVGVQELERKVWSR